MRSPTDDSGETDMGGNGCGMGGDQVMHVCLACSCAAQMGTRMNVLPCPGATGLLVLFMIQQRQMDEI